MDSHKKVIPIKTITKLILLMNRMLMVQIYIYSLSNKPILQEIKKE